MKDERRAGEPEKLEPGDRRRHGRRALVESVAVTWVLTDIDGMGVGWGRKDSLLWGLWRDYEPDHWVGWTAVLACYLEGKRQCCWQSGRVFTEELNTDPLHNFVATCCHPALAAILLTDSWYRVVPSPREAAPLSPPEPCPSMTRRDPAIQAATCSNPPFPLSLPSHPFTHH